MDSILTILVVGVVVIITAYGIDWWLDQLLGTHKNDRRDDDEIL